jgi:hypothetical protein
MSIFARNLERISSRVNRLLGSYGGERFPFYYVCEHPRAGGTWLADMLADYLQIPFPKNSIFPLGCAGVLHNHWAYSDRLQRVAYVYRDGRDVAISTWFYVTKALKNGDAGSRAYIGRRYPYLLGRDVDLDDCARWLPRFIDDWSRRPYGCAIGWGDHVAQWTRNRPNVVPVSYEELKRDTRSALTQVATRLTRSIPDPERIAASVEKFRFERQTGRSAGHEDPSNAKRKGIVGDWRNHFTLEAGRVFHRRFGDTLIAMGYENRSDWWLELPPRDLGDAPLIFDRRVPA